MSAKSRGKNVRVKSFKLGWLSQTIGDVRNDKWLTPCKNDSTRGVCLVCKDSSGKIGKSFSILEGFSAIRNHAKGKGHIDNFISHQNRIQDNENNDAPPEMEQISMEEALANQNKRNAEKDRLKLQVLEAQTIWSHTLHSHGLPSQLFDCTTKLFSKMFPDSEIAKYWGSDSKKGLGRDKGDYQALFGIAPFLDNQLFANIKKSPGYSVDIDESDVLGTSQLDVNNKTQSCP